MKTLSIETRKTNREEAVSRITTWAEILAEREEATIEEMLTLVWHLWNIKAQARLMLFDEQAEMNPIHKAMLQIIVNSASAAIEPYDTDDFLDQGAK